jgi:hypothetical protein
MNGIGKYNSPTEGWGYIGEWFNNRIHGRGITT